MDRGKISHLVAVCFCCVACGGGGSAPETSNPYAGAYFGEYVDQNGNPGQIQITIAQTGYLSGIFSTPTATYNLIQGTVGVGGKGRVHYGSGTAEIQFAPIGMMNLTPIIASTSLTITPDQAKYAKAQAVFVSSQIDYLPAGNPYTGSYAGTLHDATTNKTQALAIIIQTNGAVSGSIVNAVNGTPTLAPISGTLSSAGALSLVTQSNPVTVTGTLTKGVQIYGPVQLSNGDTGNIVIYPSTSSIPPPEK
jgi:hypothetical protein